MGYCILELLFGSFSGGLERAISYSLVFEVFSMTSSKNLSFNGSSFVVGDLTWTLPGMAPSNSDCGTTLESDSFHSCDRIICSECYSRVHKKQAYHIYKHIDESSLDKSYFRHIIFSPPQEWVIERMRTEGSFGYLRDKASEVMKEAGVVGAVLFFHPLRLTEFAREFYGELGLKPKDIWKKIGEGKIPFSEDTVKMGPHFHALATGYLVPSDKFEQETVWSYSNIGSLEYSLRNRIKYNLNHVGLALDGEGESIFNSYTYIGDLKRGGRK